MLCEHCGQKQATVHLTQVIDGEVTKLHLCEDCAKKGGFDLAANLSMTDFLLGLDGESVLTTPPVGEIQRSCPTCHMRRSDFKKAGQFGCPDCYEAFKEELTPLLRAMHRGGDRHVGKIPSRMGLKVQATAELAQLERSLQEAVASERFEEAARLRDAVKACRRRLAQAEKETGE